MASEKVKIFVTTGFAGKDVMLDADIQKTALEKKTRIPLVIDEGEKRKGAVGIVEPQNSKSVRMFIPDIFDDIYNDIEDYTIEKKTSSDGQTLFLLTK